MPKPTSPVSSRRQVPVKVVIVTLDGHLASAATRAAKTLQKNLPGLTLKLHAATEWEADPDALARCRQDIADGHIIVATMLFMEDHLRAVLPALEARRRDCDALVGCLADGAVVKLTKLGGFGMDGPQRGPLALLKKLRGARRSDDANGSAPASSGARQMALLRRLPKILRYIPGTAQDLRAYFLTLQYWLAGSEQNIENLVRLLVSRYAAGSRAVLRGLKAAAPVEYPDVGLYHPRLPGPQKNAVAATADKLPRLKTKTRATVGLLLMRSYVLAGNTAHYDAVIAALEARGLAVIPAFASGLDARPAVRRFFLRDGRPCVDAVASLTGFSLVGGPAYNDARAAEQLLAELDVPYLAAQAVEFQTLEQWRESERGLLPVEATMMVAIPELDGATGSLLFGGRGQGRDMQPEPERAAMLAARLEKLIALRQTPRGERKLAVVLFNFPPNAGATGSAAHLAVFPSLYATLAKLRAEGYTVELPADADELRQRLLAGNAARYGTDANVHALIAAADHVRREPWLAEIEAQWGPAPGRQLSDGSSLFVLGARFGNVFVGVQPGFGYEGDPMRLLFERGFAPTHAFAAFYRYLRDDLGAHAVLHFGTHGALEFMPGKQTGLAADCWPDRLINDLPNFYLYAANNPSEGSIAKRRAAATLISYLTPPVSHAGLYRELLDLKASLDRWRGLAPDAAPTECAALVELLHAQAQTLDLIDTDDWDASDPATVAVIDQLNATVLELEYALIPCGLHQVGQALPAAVRRDMLQAAAETHSETLPAGMTQALDALVAGRSPAEALEAGGLDSADASLGLLQRLAEANRLLAEDHELDAIVTALDGRFVRPAPAGDVLRNPEILPTGRNLHGFDPFRIPSAFALRDGARQAERLLEKHRTANGTTAMMPESIALVLWGTDNLKSEGGPLAQALALLGARPRFDSYGRLSGAELIPLAELGRPRVDVLMTLSGIFRDLLPLQTRVLAEAAYLAATADEPVEQNFIRKHALAYQQRHGCDLETAALRVFSNAEGAYGSNVNHLIDSSCWNDEDELAETYSRRKCFAYGRQGRPVPQAELLQTALAGVDLAYQNLESVELGITTVDHYFDTLGGISRSVQRAKGGDERTAIPVYIGDQTCSEGKVRTLAEQVALETRTRVLNPKWYEQMLEHGYEGVRHIEAHVTNTVGWSATTGQVAPWVYQQLSQTFVLDDAMRQRMAALNPAASAKVANRLLEAHERRYWSPDQTTLEALRQAGEELEDYLEGVGVAPGANAEAAA